MWYNFAMDKKTIISAIMALAAGVAIGYLAAPKSAPEPTKPERPSRRAQTHVVDADQKAGMAAMRQRIRDLERRLAAATASATAQTNAAAKPPQSEERVGFGPPRPEEWRARMEAMRQNDPERYTQMTNNMARWRSRMAAATQDRMAFFASLDTSTLTPKQRETHERLQELLARREELFKAMDVSNDSITDEQRGAAHQEMRQIMGQLQSLEREERDMLLNQAARNLGCSGAMAKELVDTIKTIYDATQSWGGGGRRFRGGPPSRGGSR